MGVDLSQYVVDQGRVDLGIHRQYPISCIGKCGAFYRIFFGQEYRVAIRKGQVDCTVGMMVGKGMRREGDAQFLQVLEKALRMADTGHGMNVGFVEVCGSGCLVGAQQIVKDLTIESHLILPFARLAAIHYNCINCLQARYRFAQRTSGEHTSVSKAPLSVDDRDFNITLQAIMLQAVIAKHDIALRIGLQCRLSRGEAIRAYPHRAYIAMRHQKGLIPDLCGRA